MTKATTFKSATAKELEKEIEFLLNKSGMTWDELKNGAESYTLSDANFATYRTIKSIKWVTEGK